MKQESTLSYLHHDHLGSLVAASDPSGAEVGGSGWARYSPFGQLRLGAGLPSDRLFTGQTRHNVLGSGNAGNDAYYLFQAADTVVPVNTDPKSLRALNRYAYSLNNPLKLVDPTDHFSTDQLKQWGYSQDQINAWAKNDP